MHCGHACAGRNSGVPLPLGGARTRYEPDSGEPMTDIADRPLTGLTASPTATRLWTPRWRDGRLAAGVLLVLLAVLLGVRVVGSAQRTTPLLAAGRDLPAGHVLSAADLSVVAAHLPAATSTSYWPAASLAALVGRSLVAPLGAGELVPRSDLAGPVTGPTRLVSVPVDPGRVPPAAVGDLVDVLATYRTDGASGGPGVTVPVVSGAVFAGTGGSSASGQLAVELTVPVGVAAALVHASELGSLDLVLEQAANGQAGSVGLGPVTGPSGVSGAAGGAGA
jgi:Flp pilus assembly protein CpaB